MVETTPFGWNRSNDSALEGHWILAKDTISPTSNTAWVLLIFTIFNSLEMNQGWNQSEMTILKEWLIQMMMAWIALIASDYSDHHTKIA